MNPNGLNNTGNLCYLNALIQAINTLPIWVKKLKSLNTTEIQKELIPLILNFKTHELRKSLLKYADQFPENSISSRNPEDSSEILDLILKILNEKSLEELFHVRYCYTIICNSCKTKKVNNQAPCDIAIRSSSFDIQEILTQSETPIGYHCENCDSNNVIRISELVRIRQIVILEHPINQNILEKFTVDSISGKLHYNLYAIVENPRGHYFARCIRKQENEIGIWILNDNLTRKVNTWKTQYHIALAFYQLDLIT